ncbi:MAG: hypothetical protein ACXW6T_16935, partial [Candidatus Binatia bacterium]
MTIESMQSFLRSAAPASTLASGLICLLLLAAFGVQVTGQQPNQQRPRRVTKDEAQSPAKATQEPQTEEVDEGDVVRVETQLVSVPTVVTNSVGRPVPGLRAENFLLFENSQPQKITNFATTEAPFEIALLLDTSGSTREDVGLIRQAANAFIDALRPGDRVAVVGFNTARQGQTIAAKVEVLAKLT